MRSLEADEIEARLARARKLEDDLDARLALVIARQQERQGVIKDLEAVRREAIATGKHAVHLPPRRGRRSRLSPTQQTMTRAARIARGR